MRPWNYSGTECIKDKSDGPNAVVTAWYNGVVCGTGIGRSNHKIWDPYVAIQLNGDTTLDSQVLCPPPPPSDQCPSSDYYWNGFDWVYTPGSPIIISLDKNSKYRITSAKSGVQFDLDGDGVPEQISWTNPNSDVAFLALDRDGDGRITSGKELYGNHTFPGVSNGFDALARDARATNGNVKKGSVTSDDPLFARPLLWTDTDQNGLSEPWELRPASEVISEIGLGYEPRTETDNFGNRFLYRGWVHLRTAPGKNDPKNSDEDVDRTTQIWDVWFTGLK
jgi:hypothetical protein